MSIQSLRARYVAIFGDEPTPPEKLRDIERILGVQLPDDFRQIAAFYRGGILGGTSVHAFDVAGPATNVTEETLRLREAVNLPTPMIALAEPDESLIVVNTASTPNVIWCDTNDVGKLAELAKLRQPDLWNSFEEFFEELLLNEECDRE